MSSLTCGLDVHSDWTDVTVRRNHDGKIVRSVRRLPNGSILGFLKENPDISRIAMEASTSTVPLYRELEAAGYDDVLVSHPKKTRLIAESVIKTDTYVDGQAGSPLLLPAFGSNGVAINLAPLGCEGAGDNPALSPQTHTNARRRNLTILR